MRKLEMMATSCILVMLLLINLVLFVVIDDLRLIRIFGLLLLDESLLLLIGLVFRWRWLVSIRVAFGIIRVFSLVRDAKMPIYWMSLSFFSISRRLLTHSYISSQSKIFILLFHKLNSITLVTPILYHLTKLNFQQSFFILKLHNYDLKVIFIENCLF